MEYNIYRTKVTDQFDDPEPNELNANAYKYEVKWQFIGTTCGAYAEFGLNNGLGCPQQFGHEGNHGNLNER